ncbi:Kelch-type beta propeller [Lasallia pustulata]|uniref:Kelch-type beta propeller n=1 Tax=Lasallia pustulata TaxID=136370 RepID=A0A1W5CVG2_9LECA|nr:Kelch-type beta propeller [Lasallia pustulata]
MSFLFGKKKQPQPPALPPASRDTHTPGGSSTGAPTANGAKDKDKPGARTQTPTPGSSVNNSINSLGGAATPSPEQNLGARGGAEQDLQYGPRLGMSGHSPPNSNPNADPYPWSQRRLTFTTPQPNPFPRYGAAVNAVSSKEGEVYLMGGLINGSMVKGDLWMIEAGGGNLACYPIGTTSEGPGPRVGHASLLVGNAFIVFGGDTKTDDGDMLDDNLYLLNTSTRQWTRPSPPGPKPAGRYGHTLNILGSKIYIFGGQVEGYFFNDLLAFDLNALQSNMNRWEMLIQNSNDGGPPEGQLPPARTNHTIISWKEKLYLFGGTNGTQWFNDVWSYDPRVNGWTQLDCIGYIPATREGHSAALVNDVMYIFGGRTEEGTDLGDLAAFRITSRRWYTFQNMGPSPSPRSGHSMTAFGNLIVVLAGEPSSAPRDPGELSLVYILDTMKIKYPNDQQIQQTPSGERVPGNRRPSGERSAIPQSRGAISREGFGGPPEGPKRVANGPRESLMNGPVQMGRGQEPTMANGPPPFGQASRLPRASAAQVPSGPPPQQQAPTPRANGLTPNGVIPMASAPRSKTPTREGRGFGSAVDTARAASFDNDSVSPITCEPPRQIPQIRAPSPLTNGRRTPTQQQSRLANNVAEPIEPSMTNGDPYRSGYQGLDRQISVDHLQERSAANAAQQRYMPTQYDQPVATADQQRTMLGRLRESNMSGPATVTQSDPQQRYTPIQYEQPVATAEQPRTVPGQLSEGNMSGPATVAQSDPSADLRKQHEALVQQQEILVDELEAAKKRNAWYASELTLAKQAGYQQKGPLLDGNAAQSFDDDDKPLVEALLAMRAELANVQGSVDSQVQIAAQKVAEVERQRDAAVAEAAYVKAKLAAHGGSQAGTPQPDGAAQEDLDRATDISRKLAVALNLKDELQSKLDAVDIELQAEKRARMLADSTADAAQKRVAGLEQLHHPGLIENLRAELHQAETLAREEAARSIEAQSRTRLLDVDKEDLKHQLEEALNNSKNHTTTLGSLREAVAASSDKSFFLEKRLEEERGHRESLERKLLQLRSEHEERTAELETTTRKLRDAEELADSHAKEAQTHREVVMTGLDKLNSRSLDLDDHENAMSDERVTILQQQIKDANLLVEKNQAHAEMAVQKLRQAEERIAGLEAYQEQASRENLTVRKQLQGAVRETQMLQAQHSEARKQLAIHQRDAHAVLIQHSALKDLLSERGISVSEHRRSRNLDSPGSRFGSPERARLRELEQELNSTIKAHEETKASFETREQEADRVYREKLEQLESDYQSAVHYVKGTEKMLKRIKDELTKYKTQNARLQAELEESHRSPGERSVGQDTPAEWETERQSLRQELERMQERVKSSISHLEHQIHQVRSELVAAQQERDHYRSSTERTQEALSQATQQARADLDQLKAENTHLECRALDAEQKVSFLLDQAPSEPLVAKLFRANERLAAENSIGTHMILGLTAALREEKKRRKRGKRLNLLGEEESGPQFFSPGRVTAARTWQAEKEEEEQQHRQDIESRRALVAFKKLQKEEEKLQKAAAAVERQRLAVEAKTAKAAESQARKEL